MRLQASTVSRPDARDAVAACARGGWTLTRPLDRHRGAVGECQHARAVASAQRYRRGGTLRRASLTSVVDDERFHDDVEAIEQLGQGQHGKVTVRCCGAAK